MKRVEIFETVDAVVSGMEDRDFSVFVVSTVLAVILFGLLVSFVISII
jgi:hypothetical protein